MKRMARLAFSFGCLAATLVACHATDGPTDPSLTNVAHTGSVTHTQLKQSRDADTVRALKRLTPLATELSASAVIGPEGGTIAIPEAGGAVFFPEGALSEATIITMTARAGYDVAYEFEPHLVFPVAVIVQQSLRNTVAELFPETMSRLGGAYFENDLATNFVDARRQFARVKEVRPGTIDESARLLTFTVEHFSGYLASSGRTGRDEKDD
jgi:hypothetical protein